MVEKLDKEAHERAQKYSVSRKISWALASGNKAFAAGKCKEIHTTVWNKSASQMKSSHRSDVIAAAMGGFHFTEA